MAQPDSYQKEIAFHFLQQFADSSTQKEETSIYLHSLNCSKGFHPHLPRVFQQSCVKMFCLFLQQVNVAKKENICKWLSVNLARKALLSKKNPTTINVLNAPLPLFQVCSRGLVAFRKSPQCFQFLIESQISR